MFRMMFLTFWGTFRGTEDQKSHVHESPFSMTIPLIILAVLSALGGFIGVPEVLGGGHWLAGYLSPVFAESTARLGGLSLSHSTEYLLMGVSVLGVVVAIIYAYFKYVKNAHVPISDNENRSMLSKVSYNKFYFDEFYAAIITKPLDALSRFFYKVIDKSGIDGFVNGVARVPVEASKGFRLLQTGNVDFYVFAMVIGTIAVLLYSFIKF